MDYGIYQGRGRDKTSGVTRPISYLPNTLEWVDNIICLETETDRYSADEVLGGVSGIDNAQAQALSNRTQFLRDKFTRLAEIVSAMQLALAPMLTTVKNLVVSTEQILDWEHQAWLQFTDKDAFEQWQAKWEHDPPDFRVYYANGTFSINPIIELITEGGSAFYLRTDGTSSLIPAVDTLIDEQEESN